MWDYDKLFAENNVVGLKDTRNNKIFVHGVCNECYWGETNRVNWRSFKNEELKIGGFEIQYIIRLDEHGNVVEKLFDREQDMVKPMPELETGMFVSVLGSGLGFVDAEHNRIIYKNGGYDFIDDEKDNKGIAASRIAEVYDTNTFGFNCCDNNTLIWRSPEYQVCLDFKN